MEIDLSLPVNQRRLVVLESPYHANPEKMTKYAQLALKDSLDRGEAPIASHLLYTQVLDEYVWDERWAGVVAGVNWVRVCDAMVVYADYGISTGVSEAMDIADKLGKPVEVRYIGANL